MRALVKEATKERRLGGRRVLEMAITRLIDLVQTIQNRGHEHHGAKNRNLQALWRSVRADEEDSFSAVRLGKMVRDWLRGVFVWALCRCWHQFPVAVRQFSIASGEPGRDSVSIGPVEAMAAG